jgi:hypothetical protein
MLPLVWVLKDLVDEEAMVVDLILQAEAEPEVMVQLAVQVQV